MINLRMQPAEAKKLSPRITVVGVGGAGGNAVNNMISSGLEGVEFLVCNTDAQALESTLASNKLHLGTGVTAGLGAGGRPDIGRAAAEESLDELQRYIEGSNMVFITCGMGGGTGTGAAPVIAKACRDAGVLTVGVVTKPFQFEGSSRARAAEQGIEEIQEYVDTLIVIPNQNLFRIANEKTTFAEAFKMADSVLQAGVRGITDLIMMPGLINLDFADIRSIMTEMGKAVMGTGEASGEKRAMDAAEKAISNPLLDDVSMKGARGVIINVTGGYDMTLYEVDEACNRIRDEVDPEASIIFGSTFDESLEGQMRVSIVATGIDKVAESAGGSHFGSKPLERPSRPKYELPSTVRPAYAAPARPLASAPVAPQAAAPVAPVEPTAQADIFTASAAPQASNYGGGNAALRGSVQGGSFIPPAPVQAEPQTLQQPAYAPRQPVAPQPQYQAPAAQAPAYVQPQMEAPQVEQPKAPLGLYAAADQPPQEQQAAPVAPQHAAQQQRGKASFFERLTGSGWKAREGGEERADSFDEPRATATPAKPATQGSLNIDSPVKPMAPNFEDELDIPAFLRRQAN